MRVKFFRSGWKISKGKFLTSLFAVFFIVAVLINKHKKKKEKEHNVSYWAFLTLFSGLHLYIFLLFILNKWYLSDTAVLTNSKKENKCMKCLILSMEYMDLSPFIFFYLVQKRCIIWSVSRWKQLLLDCLFNWCFNSS